MISASLMPALNNESRERASPVTNKQSKDWDSLMASGSGSINATCLLSSLRAAATPLPTSPAPAIITRILLPSLSGAPIILTYRFVINLSSWHCGADFDKKNHSSSITFSPRIRSAAARSCLPELLRVLR